MKKIILILFLIVGTHNIQSQELKWYNDMNEAMKVSKKTKKPLLLFFTGSDWCGWCIRLQKEVLKTPEFAKWSDKVVLVELDFPRKTAQPQEIKNQNMQLQQLLAVRGYPTVWFVKASEGKDGKINLEQLGSTGYVAGGPTVWLQGADQILANKKS